MDSVTPAAAYGYGVIVALKISLVLLLPLPISLCASPVVSPPPAPPKIPSGLPKTVERFSFENLTNAAEDFGQIYHYLPLAILYPKSISDISATIKFIYDLGPTSGLTVAARGRAHSVQGQAQAEGGVVIYMDSLPTPKMKVNAGKLPSVDVAGGELWINILNECLKHGLTPKSWTDYLHLTVGGTLSYAGMSGQAFLHGPQIDNVEQLEVVTGKGEVLACSENKNSDLFHGVLGGLGQFGIITSARISLGPAPQKVMWIKALYSNFSQFATDQEHLISSRNMFNYIEGFISINNTSSLNNSDGERKTLFRLEMAMYYTLDQAEVINQKINNLLSELSYIHSTLSKSEVSYVEFLDRVHTSELQLRANGLWDVPHPWLTLIIPKSKINNFVDEVFGNILEDTNSGKILIYPINQSMWNNQTSFVTPDEKIVYFVAFLYSATPSSKGRDGLGYIQTQNKRVLTYCATARFGMKENLPHYNTQEEWKAHFGTRWDVFLRRKLAYDPLALLAPSQRIFKKGMPL